MEIKWNSKFTASQSDKELDSKKIILKGVILDSQLNKNQWMIEPEDFEQVAKDFIGKQIRTDHSEGVEHVLGKIINTELDDPHDYAKTEWDPPTNLKHVHFFSEISTTNENILIPLKNGYINSVSPAVDSRTLLCSECRKPVIDRFVKDCGCKDGGLLLKDITPRECSIVASPAYSGTTFVPYGFSAAVDKSLGINLVNEDILKIIEEELSKRNITFI